MAETLDFDLMAKTAFITRELRQMKVLLESLHARVKVPEGFAAQVDEFLINPPTSQIPLAPLQNTCLNLLLENSRECVRDNLRRLSYIEMVDVSEFTRSLDRLTTESSIWNMWEQCRRTHCVTSQG